jgi:hypothetical protein
MLENFCTPYDMFDDRVTTLKYELSLVKGEEDEEDDVLL